MIEILTFEATPYFAFGQQQKSSLIAQFCRQNKYQHLKNPILQALQNKFANQTIIEGSIQLFKALQAIKPQLQVIFIGNKFTNDQIQIRRDYRKIGKCIQVRQINYEKFRKAMFPNLIFFYGPTQEQNLCCAQSLAKQIGYCRVALPPNANSFIKQFKKTVNYTVNGLFTCKQQLAILQEFFNIKIIHLQYNRIDLPQESDYFDKQFQILPYLKSKPYYRSVNGISNQIKIIDLVSEVISPSLVYAAFDLADKKNYLEEYVHSHQSDTLLLSIFQIQSINKRKNIKLAETPLHRFNILNQILYRDFNIKRAIILDFPFLLHQVVNFQSANTKFQAFIDLISPHNILYFKTFNTPMYFMQHQKRIVPNMNKPLQEYLSKSIKYWLINGPSGSGKTTVSKYLSVQYGFKLIQYQSYFALIKQKLLGPEDGQQVPFKKILNHFKTLLFENVNQVYVIDGLPFDNKDLQEWIKTIGTPLVINLQVSQTESIRRTRRKNQADVNAQINEQQLNKAKQSQAKSQSWIEKMRKISSAVQINQVNFNSPLILSQKLISKIFRKNIYLIQSHKGLAFQNIALKYNLGFLNLYYTSLRQSLKTVRSISNKDVIICYYHQTEQKLISQDLYWIQKNLGNIRYLAIWQPQETQLNQEKIHLQRPKAPQKPKVEGVEGQQKPSQEQSGDKKKEFDIFAYQWSKPPANSINLSQWFIKSKKKVQKVESKSQKQLFDNWSTIVSSLERSQEVAIYQTFK